jgi:predicted RecA/RadA family phage recombinase
MKNYVQRGDTMTLTAPYDRNSGEGALVGSIFGVAANTVANATDGEFDVVGVFTLAKVSAQAWTQGALIYWDNTAKLCTTVSSGNKLIGVAASAAGNPSGAGDVRLNGSFSS